MNSGPLQLVILTGLMTGGVLQLLRSSICRVQDIGSGGN